MKVDFHAHFYPKEYLKQLVKFSPGVVRKKSRSSYLVNPKTSFAPQITKSMHDIGEHLRVMDKQGITMEVLSLAPGWPEPVSPKKALTLAKIINDRTSEVVQKYPDRFTSLASLPLTDAELAVEEFKRATGDLGMRGCIVGTHVAGKPLDTLNIAPLFRELQRLRLPVFIHPAPEFRGRWFNDYCLLPSLGLIFDTTFAVVRLALSGVLERFPDLKVVAAHLGGTFPYVVGRVDRVSRAFPYCNFRLRKPPSEYMKNVYVDIISFHEPSLRAAYEFLGSERLMIGTDYPFNWGTASEVLSYVERLGLRKEDIERIYYRNAVNLLHLN